jgi:hypothetical protein
MFFRGNTAREAPAVKQNLKMFDRCYPCKEKRY